MKKRVLLALAVVTAASVTVVPTAMAEYTGHGNAQSDCSFAGVPSGANDADVPFVNGNPGEWLHAVQQAYGPGNVVGPLVPDACSNGP